MKKNKFDVFIVSRKELLSGLTKDWIDFPTNYGEIIDVKATSDGKCFTFFFTEPWLLKDKPTREIRNEFRAKIEPADKELAEIFARVRRGEISSIESVDLAEKVLVDLKTISLDEDDMLKLLHKIRFPSFWGSFFEPEAWLEPGVGQKISKVEVTDDGVEFTIGKF